MRKNTALLIMTILLIGTGSLGSGMAAPQREGFARPVNFQGGAFDGTGHPNFGGRSRGMGIPSQRILQNVLGFTDQQFNQLDLLKEDFRAALKPLLEEQRGLREPLKSALDSDPPDALLVGELVISSRNVMQQIRALRQSFQDSFVTILTVEQVDLLDEFEANRSSRRGFRRGRRQPGEDG